MNKSMLILLSFAALFLLCACGSKNNADAEIIAPVTAYYDAIVSQNRDRVPAVTCGEWEKEAIRDVDSFMGVKAEMKDFTCSLSATEGDSATVQCEGAIAASYGAEITEFPLSNRQHKVIKEQGEWRLCGYESAVK